MSLTPQRLRRLVRYRERLERLQEVELAEAQRLRDVRLHALESSRDERARSLESGDPAARSLNIADLVSGIDYLRRADREIAAREAALAHSDADVAEERAALLERRKDRKAMDTLLDRRLEADRIEQRRKETRRIDELAVNRWQSPRSDSGERSA